MSYPTDTNGKKISMDIRQDADGTWSRNVWAGFVNVTNVRRYTGYATKAAARAGDISETPLQTNKRLAK